MLQIDIASLDITQHDDPKWAYHITPLHYLPSILTDGTLFAKDVLQSRAILPRATAFRRDRMLGLGCYVHFGFQASSPLFIDKLKKGYPHVLLVFDASTLTGISGSGLLAGNTKAWKSKAALRLQPMAITKPAPRTELLVKYAAGLEGLDRMLFTTDIEREMIERLIDRLQLDIRAPLTTRLPQGITYRPVHLDIIARYFEACAAAHAVLRPPDIPFD